ncbi:MAG: hypothetical protein M3O22_08960, partial [Pseudomonadota bacterium]|nr:hypothetical protein [Pseudomonadota bacterium]
MKRLTISLSLVVLFAAIAGAAFYGSRIKHEERFFPKTYLRSLFPVYHVTDDPTPVEVYLAGRKFAFPKNMIIDPPNPETAMNPRSYNELFLRVILPDFEGLNAKTKNCYMQKPKECVDIVKIYINWGEKQISPEEIYTLTIDQPNWKKNEKYKDKNGLIVYPSIGNHGYWLHVG